MLRFEALSIFLLHLAVSNADMTGQYRAAVIEHAIILPSERNGQVTRDEAKRNLWKNLEIYQKYTEDAAKQVPLNFCD